MEKAIRVLKARMKEYKEIGNQQSMDYYHSCEKAVLLIEYVEKHRVIDKPEKVVNYDGDEFIDQLF